MLSLFHELRNTWTFEQITLASLLISRQEQVLLSCRRQYRYKENHPKDRKFYRVVESRRAENGRCFLVPGPNERLSDEPGIVAACMGPDPGASRGRFPESRQFGHQQGTCYPRTSPQAMSGTG